MELEANGTNNFPGLSLKDNLFVFNIIEKTTFCGQMVSIFIEYSEEIFVKRIRVGRNCVLQGRIWLLLG